MPDMMLLVQMLVMLAVIGIMQPEFNFPFGGVKGSGIGREGIRYAIREMSYRKTLVI